MQACVAIPEGADHVAVVGENRKLLVFPLSELPEMSRGRGVRLQKYRDGGLSDVKAFRSGRGFKLARQLGAHLDGGRHQGVDRVARPGRPPAAQRLPAQQPVWVRLRLLSWPGLTGPPSNRWWRM
jgi:DNA gyrase/topoisomerase IV subunit A